ncbi:hypothetical protein SRABI106_01129 [Rahnella aquatilis]|nr:hypothetical protein SRABI106_01129 [Rahnella aquatilis]
MGIGMQNDVVALIRQGSENALLISSGVVTQNGQHLIGMAGENNLIKMRLAMRGMQRHTAGCADDFTDRCAGQQPDAGRQFFLHPADIFP